MDMRKYEALINLVINEEAEKASELFHEIVIEKSREIFESIMSEDEMGGQVGDLLDEIDSEESGFENEDEDFNDEEFTDHEEGTDEFGDEFDTDETFDLDQEDGEGVEGEELEDSVIRIEDKLDQLMREFEDIMGSKEDDFDSEETEDFSDESEDYSDDEGTEDFSDESEEDEDAVMEAIQLQKVSVTHGDDGAQKKSPVAANSGKSGMASKPFNLGHDENEKGRTAPTTKDLKGAGSFKNTPGQKARSLETAPKPVKGDDGSNFRSPVAESRKVNKSAVKPVANKTFRK